MENGRRSAASIVTSRWTAAISLFCKTVDGIIQRGHALEMMGLGCRPTLSSCGGRVLGTSTNVRSPLGATCRSIFEKCMWSRKNPCWQKMT